MWIVWDLRKVLYCIFVIDMCSKFIVSGYCFMLRECISRLLVFILVILEYMFFFLWRDIDKFKICSNKGVMWWGVM